MSAFDPRSWYYFSNADNSTNTTLTAATNSQTAFDPNSLLGLYYTSVSPSSVPDSQLWQIYPVTTDATSPFIIRNRALGPSAYLTTAWTTRKCGGGQCATVPVLANALNQESLWKFGAWGFSDPTGLAFIYNLGNGSDWRLDSSLESNSAPELLNYTDTRRLGAHWNFNSYRSFATNEAAGFSQLPSSASGLLAGITTPTGVATDSVTPFTISPTGSGAQGTITPGPGNANANADTTTSQSSAGLPTAAAIGLGVGLGIAGVLAVLGIVLFFLHRRRRNRHSLISSSSTPHSGDDTAASNAAYFDNNGKSRFTDAKPGVVGDHPAHRKRSDEKIGSPVIYTELDSSQYRSEMSHPSDSIRPELIAQPTNNKPTPDHRYELSAGTPTMTTTTTRPRPR